MIKNYTSFMNESADLSKYDINFVLDGLNRYMSDEFNLVHNMNIILNDRSRDWYMDIGRYLYDKNGKEKIERLFPFIKDDSDKTISFLSTMFITSILDQNSLEKMFGSPICHSRFGEGFDKKRKYNYT